MFKGENDQHTQLAVMPNSVRTLVNTQTGRQFRLQGKGMPQMRGRGEGDMYVQAMVETPVNLSKSQKELLQQFESSLGEGGTSPESESFFKKAKDIWNDITD